VRDGVTLYADVYRPAGKDPHPVLLMREPYDKSTAQTGPGYAHPSWWAGQGWVVVVQDCRGRFRSEGEWYPFVHEAEDGYDAVEWASRLLGWTITEWSRQVDPRWRFERTAPGPS
jgi:uncharacterized protein